MKGFTKGAFNIALIVLGIYILWILNVIGARIIVWFGTKASLRFW